MNESVSSFANIDMNGLHLGTNGESPECKHYWVIESPHGPVSTGTCKLCSEHREFWNSIPTTGWERRADRTKSLRNHI